MEDEMLDLYTDYLIASFARATATGLSQLVDGQLSHDQISRFLYNQRRTGVDLWLHVRPLVNRVAQSDGVLIIDDTIAEKAYSDENRIVAWHWDHAKQRNVKGINFLSAVYYASGTTIPIDFVIVEKDEEYVDKNGKSRRRSTIPRNEHARKIMVAAKERHVVFKYVLADIFFASSENMSFIHYDLHKKFIFPVKGNRLVAQTEPDKHKGQFVRVEKLPFVAGETLRVYLKGLSFPILIVKQVFTNEDGSQGVRYLTSNDLSLDEDSIATIFKKRWKVEEYHGSVKQNAALTKSPTHSITSQSSHLFASICAYVKLERLRSSTKLNHYALKAKLYANALRAAYTQLAEIRATLQLIPKQI